MPKPAPDRHTLGSDGESSPGAVRLRLRSVNQLFNSLDPSPFIEKDIDPEAEAFIISWAREHSTRTPLSLTIHLSAPIEAHDKVEVVEAAVQNYFEYRMGMADRELREVIREGRRSLAVGLVFLLACSLVATMIEELQVGAVGSVLREGFLIGGWVAMWRPLELLLYSWRPVRRNRELFRRLSEMTVRVEADH